jgi:uncharacterized protein (DUF427 family)
MRPLPSAKALQHYIERARVPHWAPPPLDRIVKPGPGQESVWDFPRPPRVEDVAARVRVVFGGVTIADSARAIRVLETAGAPCYYLPPSDCKLDALQRTSTWTICEWKGIAFAYDVSAGGRTVKDGAWSYPEPLTDLGMGYERIAGYFAFYASKMDACFIGDEQVTPQPGGYYGGWVTANLTGPIKGEPGGDNW